MVPVGTIVAFAGAEIPENWFLCDGAAFDSEAYQTLFRVLDRPYVPDLRGRFLRGLDPDGQVDPEGVGRRLLDPQHDQIASHNHGYTRPWPTGIAGAIPGDGGVTTLWDTTSATGGTETRPRNVAVHYIIHAGAPASGARGVSRA